ncbi:uncharacterized protein YegL [Breznakia sp. PF5-3]|uniref:vWA domain-containing protein n=1 Tax=unclassified Breznakia TaxID=2623764 RepID=UPI00240608C5|nr:MULTISPECIES: vWA domain-containing protein [unclassified Breznakia]MDL2276253.1 VWA domain-containing protein [Breznakia sp. OttesenSCG-928-G09]MDF9824911.1 uncharacterized protein YegL [Breznakia sp. PM6-1]MDF9835590.1 uncharacterized protein YegL [Breznakia sp. PF5-3]MDF9837994.1 uncharacterized protein YegL [Breznakia sp. PFB2-8]MDF9859983.1 uncharacterized protein YegL [Breznakia sp. PH5-24]
MKRKIYKSILMFIVFLSCITVMPEMKNTKVSANEPTGAIIFVTHMVSGSATPVNSEIGIKIEGPTNTNSCVEVGNYEPFFNLADGTYSVTLVEPMGLRIKRTSVDYMQQVNSTKFNVEVVNGKAVPVDIIIEAVSLPTFYSFASIQNELLAGQWSKEKLYSIDLEIQPKPAQPRPVDVVFVVDLSFTMAYDIDYKGIPSDPKYSRLHLVKETTKEFVKALSIDAHPDSKLSIITYSRYADVAMDWTTLNGINTTSVHSIIDSWEVDGITMTDLGFKEARRQLEKRNQSSNERFVVLFTDGVPGGVVPSYGPSSNNYDWYKSKAYTYVNNTFQVMAEAQNQANILKGVRGQTTSTNESFIGYGNNATNQWIPYYGVKLGSGYTWEDYRSVRNNSQYSLYNTSYIPYVGDPSYPASPETFSSEKGGNYVRSALGLGATIFSIGLFDTTSYPVSTNPNDLRLGNKVQEFMENVTSAPVEKNFRKVTTTDELGVAFDLFSGVISGNFKNVYTKYYIDDNFEVVSAGDGRIKTDSNGRTYIEWGPSELKSSAFIKKNVVLKAKQDMYPTPPQNELVVEMIVNDTVVVLEDSITKIEDVNAVK